MESWEYLAYDLNDFVGSVSGYLGLFLGCSLQEFLKTN